MRNADLRQPTPPRDPLSVDIDGVWDFIVGQFPGGDYSVHGPAHWRRVERNGLLLATRTGADVTVVRLFAVLHDCCRIHDGFDDGHGERAAEYARTLRETILLVPDDSFSLLHEACTWHTEGTEHEDPTIATCWDADRLDLGRVGVIPDPARMCTAFGREIAAFGSIQPFWEAYRNEPGTG